MQYEVEWCTITSMTTEDAVKQSRRAERCAARAELLAMRTEVRRVAEAILWEAEAKRQAEAPGGKLQKATLQALKEHFTPGGWADYCEKYGPGAASKLAPSLVYRMLRCQGWREGPEVGLVSQDGLRMQVVQYGGSLVRFHVFGELSIRFVTVHPDEVFVVLPYSLAPTWQCPPGITMKVDDPTYKWTDRAGALYNRYPTGYANWVERSA